jgi:hypothetical protein
VRCTQCANHRRTGHQQQRTLSVVSSFRHLFSLD